MSTFRYRVTAEYVFDVEAETQEQSLEIAKNIAAMKKATGVSVLGWSTTSKEPSHEPRIRRIRNELHAAHIDRGIFDAAMKFVNALPEELVPTDFNPAYLTFLWNSKDSEFEVHLMSSATFSYSEWVDGSCVCGYTQFPATETKPVVELIRKFMEASK